MKQKQVFELRKIKRDNRDGVLLDYVQAYTPREAFIFGLMKYKLSKIRVYPIEIIEKKKRR